MPVSRIPHLHFLSNQVMSLRPERILDIGTGFGLCGMAFRQYCDIWSGRYDNWETIIDGIEIFPEYIGDLQRMIYDNIYIGDALDIMPTLQKYDLIYLGDVLEHFSRKDGLKVISMAKSLGTHVIIATPKTVSEQGAEFNNVHETHRSQWTPEDFKGANVSYFGNTMVINFDNTKQAYYCSAMSFYGDKVPLKKYTNIYSPTVFIGLYFQGDYETFRNHKGKKSVFWNGSDVLRMLHNPEWIKIVQGAEAKHFCHNIQLQSELRTIGISSEIAPLFFGYKDKFTINYKLSTPPKVFMCAHPGREEEYGVGIVNELAGEFTDIEFHIYGIDGISKGNIIYHGQIPEEQMDMEIRDFQACLRLNRHDGMSQIIFKSMLMGIHPIITRDKGTIKKELNRIKTESKPWTGDISDVKDLNWIQEMVA